MEGDDEDAVTKEPPVPCGLRARNAALRSLVEFFAIDEDLVTAFAETSPDDAAADLSGKPALHRRLRQHGLGGGA
jgi:hypothetical protein